MPKATDIIRIMLDQEKHYRLLSAVAHGHQWAVIQLTLSPTADQSKVAFENVSTTRFEKVVKPEGIAVLGLRAFRAISRSLWNQAEYFGWNMLALDELLDNTADKLKMNTHHRFWRS